MKLPGRPRRDQRLFLGAQAFLVVRGRGEFRPPKPGGRCMAGLCNKILEKEIKYINNDAEEPGSGSISHSDPELIRVKLRPHRRPDHLVREGARLVPRVLDQRGAQWSLKWELGGNRIEAGG